MGVNMMCPICGSLQSGSVAICTVCGNQLDRAEKPSHPSTSKNELNKWEKLSILFGLLCFFLNLLFGSLGPFIPSGALIITIAIYGITRHKKWAYYIIFCTCILSLLGLSLYPRAVDGAAFFPMIILLLTQYFAWKAYKTI